MSNSPTKPLEWLSSRGHTWTRPVWWDCFTGILKTARSGRELCNACQAPTSRRGMELAGCMEQGLAGVHIAGSFGGVRGGGLGGRPCRIRVFSMSTPFEAPPSAVTRQVWHWTRRRLRVLAGRRKERGLKIIDHVVGESTSSILPSANDVRASSLLWAGSPETPRQFGTMRWPPGVCARFLRRIRTRTSGLPLGAHLAFSLKGRGPSCLLTLGRVGISCTGRRLHLWIHSGLLTSSACRPSCVLGGN